MKNEVTVKLSFDHKAGGFKDEASMLSWIHSCLNCNTNHVSAGVQKAPPPGPLVMLSIESRHFTFEAVGRDLEHAQQVLLAGWSKHREQFGDAADRMPAADLAALSREFGIRERSIAPGEFYRDREALDLRRNAQEDRGGVPPPLGAHVVVKVDGERFEGCVMAYDRVVGKSRATFQLQSQDTGRCVWARPGQILTVTQAASAEVKAAVLEALKCSPGMGSIEPIDGDGSLMGKFKSSGRGAFVVVGNFGRHQYRLALEEAAAAGLNARSIVAVGDTATYSGEGIEFRKFEDLGLRFQDGAVEGEALPRHAVQAVLAGQDEGCDLNRIGYYPDVNALVAKVRSNKNWAQGEVFVFAESDDRFVIMKQVAPASCEMLTITNAGWLDVLTAYRIEEDELVQMLNTAMDGACGSQDRARSQQER